MAANFVLNVNVIVVVVVVAFGWTMLVYL